MSYNNCQFTWLKQKETLVSLAESLLKDSAFYDCQLCAEGHHFNVHRIILSCNSPIFSKILQEHNSDLPVITLEGISSVELGALVEFMYTGVTRISPNYLRNFFQIAKSLQLAGLNHYDNAQIDKIINDGDPQGSHADLQENYEAFSQKILKYLDQCDVSEESDVKDFTPLSASSEGIFLETSEQVDIVSDSGIIYKEDGDFVKDEDGVESAESLVVDDCLQTYGAGDSNDEDDSMSKGSILYDRYNNIFIKNKDKSFNNIPTVYGFTNVGDLGKLGETLRLAGTVNDKEASKEETDFDQKLIPISTKPISKFNMTETEIKHENELMELNKEIKVTDEDGNVVFVKLDNNTLDILRGNQATKRKQILSKNDVCFYTKKCLRIINPTNQNFLVKNPKIVGKEVKASGDDKKIYICLKCGNKYSHRRTLLHHIHWICEQPATYSCSLCPYRGKRKFQLKSHMKHAHLLKMS